MSDAGPLPPPPRRPRWLWFLLGTLGLCLLICGGLFVWANTIGYDTVQGFITTIEAVQTATAVAVDPSVSTPVPSGSPVAGGTPFASASPVAGSPLFAAGTPDGR